MTPNRLATLADHACAMIAKGFGVDDIAVRFRISYADLACVLGHANRTNRHVSPWYRLARQRARHELRNIERMST